MSSSRKVDLERWLKYRGHEAPHEDIAYWLVSSEAKWDRNGRVYRDRLFVFHGTYHDAAVRAFEHPDFCEDDGDLGYSGKIDPIEVIEGHSQMKLPL